MESSKTRNYHIRDILYNIFEDNVFQNKKEIKFVSITDPYFINDTENFGHCMDIVGAAVNRDHISTLKKNLDKAELKNVCRDIYEQCLITLPKYHNIKRDKDTRHKSKYMVFGDSVYSQKAKHNKETNDDTSRRTQKPVTPEGHRPMTSHFNIIKKCGHKLSKQDYLYYDKHIDSVKNPYKK